MTERRKEREGQRCRRGGQTDLFPQLSAAPLLSVWILDSREVESDERSEGNKVSAGGGLWTWMP